jgi:hypothetical protein
VPIWVGVLQQETGPHLRATPSRQFITFDFSSMDFRRLWEVEEPS